MSKPSCHCGNPISDERYEAGYTTCIKHASKTKKVGFMVYGHKTAGEIAVIDPSNSEALRIAHRANNRSR
jgi:hypothetical protein